MVISKEVNTYTLSPMSVFASTGTVIKYALRLVTFQGRNRGVTLGLCLPGIESPKEYFKALPDFESKVLMSLSPNVVSFTNSWYHSGYSTSSATTYTSG